MIKQNRKSELDHPKTLTQPCCSSINETKLAFETAVNKLNQWHDKIVKKILERAKKESEVRIRISGKF